MALGFGYVAASHLRRSTATTLLPEQANSSQSIMMAVLPVLRFFLGLDLLAQR